MPSVRSTLLIAAVAVSLGTMLATVPTVLDVRVAGFTGQGIQVLGVISAALFLGAGVLRCARWRVVADLRSLLMGSALIVLGGVALPMTSLAGALTRGQGESSLQAGTASATTVVVLALVMRALTSPDDVAPRARRLVVGAILSALFLFGAVVAVHSWSPELLHVGDVPPPAMRAALLSVGWLVVGVQAALCADRRPWAGKVAPLLGCMGVAEAFHGVSVYYQGEWELAATALIAAVAALTAHRSLVDLDEATASEQQHLVDVAVALAQSRASNEQQDAWREELVHDARNALAGLRAALTTLEKYDGALDGPTSDRLRSAALGEISHLEHLIIRSRQGDTTDFDLAEVVANVVEAQRANGVRVSLHPVPARAYGNPGDFATALQNLLVNARDHGGNDVSVEAATVAGRIEVHVADRGPGLADSQVATLFQRGARGPSSKGSGLGLHVSRTLMRRQGGDLLLHRHQGGATFAIVLPVAPAGLMTDFASRQRARATARATTSSTAGPMVSGLEGSR